MLSRIGALFVKGNDTEAGATGVSPSKLIISGNKFTERGVRHFVQKLVKISTLSGAKTAWWLYASQNNLQEKEVHDMLNGCE